MTTPITHCDAIDVQVWRGEIVESQHAVLAAVVDEGGALVAAFGDVDRVIFPRSAIKPLQALPLIETGAAESYGLRDTEIALACASHDGTRAHITVAETWLARLGLESDALTCGAHFPYCDHAAHEVIAGGSLPSPLHNNCSGKHLGMLTTALHCGEAIVGYEATGHPVQRRVRDALSDMLGRSLDAAPTAIDGCSVPTIGMALYELATLNARLGAAAGTNRGKMSAAGRIVSAMATQPEIVAGDGRFCTEITRSSQGAVIVKGGAEGLSSALLREPGLAIVVKAVDGAKRAAEAALAALVPRFVALGGETEAVFARYAQSTIENWRGIRTGHIRVVVPT